MPVSEEKNGDPHKIMRVAVGGFSHETNTFAPQRTPFSEFHKPGVWPKLARHDALMQTLPGRNIPAAGCIAAADRAGVAIYPTVWCAAEPGAHVTDDAFDRITDMLCDDLSAADDLDGVYLDLHGAMVTESYEDGEGETLRRVREVVGSEMPIVISLDLHANITPAMFEHASAITIYRTYPHIDMAECGERAFALLQSAMSGTHFAKVFRQSPFLLPITTQCTDLEPCKALYEMTKQLSQDGISVDFATGFPAADIYHCGPSLVAYGPTHKAAQKAGDALYEWFLEQEPAFENVLMTPDEAVSIALRSNAQKPFILADAQDNAGAGATSDTTGILHALIDGYAQKAVVGLLHDPVVAAQAHQLGIGATFEADLGGRSGGPGSEPFRGRFTVGGLGNGRFACHGLMLGGGEVDLGPMALLKIEVAGADVSVVVSSERTQCLDQAMLRHVGIDPADQRLIVVKSSVHFRADFDAMAERILVVKSPGANPCQLVNVDYRNLRAGLRLEPMSSHLSMGIR